MSMILTMKDAEQGPPALVPLMRFQIPRAAKKHPYFLEAQIATKFVDDPEKSKVVGTENARRAELYGWANPVEPHIDSNGEGRYMYALLLRGACTVHAIDQRQCRRYSVPLRAGDSFRLNDRVVHWATGRGHSICLFVGCYSEPDDLNALTIIDRGLRRLANGVWTAPRVGGEYRAIIGATINNEVWAWKGGNRAVWVRREVAQRRGFIIETCAICEKPAVRLDRFHPYYADGNRCLEHMNTDEKNGPAGRELTGPEEGTKSDSLLSLL